MISKNIRKIKRSPQSAAMKLLREYVEQWNQCVLEPERFYEKALKLVGGK